MTSWIDLARTVAPHAPALGRVLGDLTPLPGGGLVGEWFGKKLAEKLGVRADPEVVKQTIETDGVFPGHLTRPVKEVLEEANTEAAQWAALAEIEKARAADRTAQSQAINETMRAELGKVAWWHWRHLNGYVPPLWGVGLFAVVMRALWIGDIAQINALVDLLNPVVLFLGIFAGLTGWVAADTTSWKLTAATGTRPESVAGRITGAIKKR